MINLIELYEELYSLTVDQQNAIMTENYEDLLEILEQRNSLITKIDTVDIKGYINQQEDSEKTFEKLKKIMERIKKLEVKNEKIIKSNYEDLQKKLNDINIAKKARKGYYADKKYEAKFIDKKR